MTFCYLCNRISCKQYWDVDKLNNMLDGCPMKGYD